MNKKLIALAMVLLLAVGGLFAYDYATIPSVTALLKANIGEVFEHGFLLTSNATDFNYQPSLTVYDAFVTDPVFRYGYRTNAQGRFVFKMSVTDFVRSGEATGIKIASVMKGTETLTLASGVYTIFDQTNSTYLGTAAVHDSAYFKIVPAKAVLEGVVSSNEHAGPGSTAPSGAYTSTVTIMVSGS